MSNYSEETFGHWQRPASESEEQRISNAISMIRAAINESEELKSKNIEVFVQGSYANNTNVRAESDIDICVMLKDTFYTEYPDNLSDKDYGFTEGANDFTTFRQNVYNALVSKFGVENITNGNKSIKIDSNSYRVDADAVPSFQYRNYRYSGSKDPEIFKEGVKFFSNDGATVINYPKIHIENGMLKNTNTQRRYKRLTRILKRIRYKMIEDGVPVNDGITSFLIECLVWNIPNSIFNNYDSWNDRIKQAIIYLYNQTKDENKCKGWGEVSEMLYLFHSGRKWNSNMVNGYLVQLWNFLGYKS
ncbi:MAG: nucleotidyltransferase [Saprospiraceae bacterium]